jgi:hypothetical protein
MALEMTVRATRRAQEKNPKTSRPAHPNGRRDQKFSGRYLRAMGSDPADFDNPD